MKCSLEKDINTCPHYINETSECKNDNHCVFQENVSDKVIKKNEYVRSERWYEKYIKR